MTRAGKLAELEKKANALRERAAKIANEKRRILKAEAKEQRAIDTRHKIIWGAAVLKAGQTSQYIQYLSAKDREWMAAHPMSPAPVQTRVANPASAPVANPAPVQPQNLVQRMFKQP